MNNLHPLILRRLERLGIITPEAARAFLDPAHYTPAPPEALPDLTAGVARVRQAIARRERILVWGDFDVDGQTSTALLVDALRSLGADVAYHIPDRFSEGHGIHLPTLQTLLPGIGLLLTCDTGIAAHDAVRYAASQGVDTVITDHHALPPTLPEALAAINPMRLPEDHPMRHLPGVGVAFQLVRGLMGDAASERLLDLVAIGIVADVMVLVDDTRCWLQRGLAVLRSTQRRGLQAMMARAEVDPALLTEATIGFTLGPRLNALGRLANANPAVELLTTDDEAVIAERVNELEALNQQRRFLTNAVYAAAKQQLIDDPSLLRLAVIVVSGDGWHTGVVGIVASRLAEEYGRPAFVLSASEGVLSGSGRSVAGCDLVAALRQQSDLLLGYGGHVMAAGVRLPAENLLLFRRGISAAARAMLNAAQLPDTIEADGTLTLDELSLELADALDVLAPFGNGNPPLRFLTRGVQVVQQRQLGRTSDHLELTIADADGAQQKVKWWSARVQDIPEGTFDLLYTLRANTFRGQREVMIEWVEALNVEAPAAAADRLTAEVIDCRYLLDAHADLARQRADLPDALLWREGCEVDGVDRTRLSPAEALIVWNAPPSPGIWQAVLDTVQPATLILYSQPPQYDSAEPLLRYLTGMLKYALAHQKPVPLEVMAARTSHTTTTIRAALRWISAHTEMGVRYATPEVVTVERHTPSGDAPAALMERLRACLDETRAYRRFWREMRFSLTAS